MVKLPGRPLMPFVEATIDYLDIYFDKWKDKLYRVPPSPRYQHYEYDTTELELSHHPDITASGQNGQTFQWENSHETKLQSSKGSPSLSVEMRELEQTGRTTHEESSHAKPEPQPSKILASTSSSGTPSKAKKRKTKARLLKNIEPEKNEYKIVINKRKGDESESEVSDRIKQYGENHKQVMFIICSYNFADYCAHVRGWTKATQYEHDILVIHRELGVIFFQVKASKSRNTIHECKGQLYQDEKFFNENFKMLLGTVNDNLRRLKVIALPKMPRELIREEVRNFFFFYWFLCKVLTILHF